MKKFLKKLKLLSVMQMMKHNVKRQNEKSPEKVSLSPQREASNARVRDGNLISDEMQAGKGFGAMHTPEDPLEQLK